jgi:hypothetical protein
VLVPDEAYAKCVEYIRERALPQVEQLFSLDPSTITNLERSIHDTYQRCVSSRPAPSSPTQQRSGRSNANSTSASSTPAPTPTPDDNCDDDDNDDNDDDDFESSRNNNGVTDIASSFAALSFSKLFILFDSAVATYFPSYKQYLPGLLLAPSVVIGVLALYRRSARGWQCDSKV